MVYDGKHYYTIAVCMKHGPIKGKIRLRRAEDNMVYVIKTMKQAGAEVEADVMNKKEQVRNSRKERRRGKHS